MAQRVSVRIDGLLQVVRALQAIGVEVDDLKGAFSEVADQGARLASWYAPKVTGRLAGDVRGNRAKSKAVITAGRMSVPYAGPINYGWAAHGIEPAGFMQKADRDLQPYAFQRLERALNTAIKRRGLG